MKSYIIHRAIFVLTIIVCLSGCKYSNAEVSQVISSEAVTEIVETESLETEVPILENTETAQEETEQPRPFELRTIALEDIAPESILCTSIFADTAAGSKNEEHCNRYRDIVAECEKVSESPQYAVMLLDSGDRANPWFGVRTEVGIEVYGLETAEVNGDYRYTGQLIPATVLQREEAKDGIWCKVTEVVTRLGLMEWQHQAWIRVCESPQEKGVSQVLKGECTHWWFDLDRESSLDVWDVNDDGFLDILYDEGAVSGSGGTWEQYRVFVWDEKSGSYIDYDFPLVNDIDKENHKVYRAYQLGAPEQYYVIYDLKDGQYESYKELCLLYEYGTATDEEGNYILLDKAIYSEWGEVIEETDITGLDWEQTKELLEEKYPEFTFWRKG